MFRFEDGTARPVALLGVPQAYIDFVQRGGHQPSEHAPALKNSDPMFALSRKREVSWFSCSFAFDKLLQFC